MFTFKIFSDSKTVLVIIIINNNVKFLPYSKVTQIHNKNLFLIKILVLVKELLASNLQQSWKTAILCGKVTITFSVRNSPFGTLLPECRFFFFLLMRIR